MEVDRSDCRGRTHTLSPLHLMGNIDGRLACSLSSECGHPVKIHCVRQYKRIVGFDQNPLLAIRSSPNTVFCRNTRYNDVCNLIET